MRIDAADMLLVRASRLLAQPLWQVARLESMLLSRQLKQITPQRPVFICGLARSGSTMLLELLAQLPSAASPRYRDFPFVSTPWLWNTFQKLLAKRQLQPEERAHRDGIVITPESPEAMDEPLWRDFALDLPLWQTCPLRDWETSAFAKFYREHVRKLLLVRNGQRLVAKNNYHIARVAILSQLLDAQFVVPIRHPFDHVASLVRQHQLFCQYAHADRRVSKYLTAAGHFEFGPQRRTFCPNERDARTINDMWQHGRDTEGYALQWKTIYQHVCELLGSLELSERIQLIKYEEFCHNPDQQWPQLCSQLSWEPGDCSISLSHISRSNKPAPLAPDEAAAIWSITGATAENFGYTNTLD